MKVQQLLLDHLWDHFPPSSSSTSSSSLFSSQTPPTTTTTTDNSQHTRPRPPPPLIITSAFAATTPAAAPIAAELVRSPNSKSLETVNCTTSRNLNAASLQMQMQSAGGGTRWSPMPQQIEVLEALYNGGMRTPNPIQIERITAELVKHGRIEGKNVFYWFQNHKARERQKQKRGALLLLTSNSNFSPPPPPHHHIKTEEMEELLHGGSCKRKCRRWSFVELEGEDINGDRTLELFPLQPEYWKQQME